MTLRDNYFLLRCVFSTWELKELLNVLCTGFHLQKLTVSLETERCKGKIKNTTKDSPLPPAFSEHDVVGRQGQSQNSLDRKPLDTGLRFVEPGNDNCHFESAPLPFLDYFSCTLLCLSGRICSRPSFPSELTGHKRNISGAE